MIILLIVGVHPSLLLSQEMGGRIVGGKVRFDHLRYKESSLGAIRDFDFGFSSNYMKILSPAYYQQDFQGSSDTTQRKKIPSIALGFKVGISGYYNNTDSLKMHNTEMILGPIVRYYTAKDIFFEGSVNIHYVFSRIGNQSAVPNKYVFIPYSKTFAVSLEAGFGYRIILSRNISLEPMVTYQRRWAGLQVGSDSDFYFPYETNHGINLYVSFQFYF